MRAIALAWIAVLVPAANIVAQTAALQPGEKVQLTCPAAGTPKLVGWFRLIERDSMLLVVQRTRVDPVTRGATSDPVEVRVALDDITRVQRQVGTKSNRARGAAIGFAIGALIGGGIGAASGDDEPGILAMSAGEKAIAAGASLGLLGGLIGFVAAGSSDKWEDVPVHGWSVSVVPRRSGVALGARLPLPRF